MTLKCSLFIQVKSDIDIKYVFFQIKIWPGGQRKVQDILSDQKGLITIEGPGTGTIMQSHEGTYKTGIFFILYIKP